MTEPVNPSPFETIKDPAPQAGTGLTTALTASVTHVLEDKLEEWPSSAVYSKATRLVLIQIEAKASRGLVTDDWRNVVDRLRTFGVCFDASRLKGWNSIRVGMFGGCFGMGLFTVA